MITKKIIVILSILSVLVAGKGSTESKEAEKDSDLGTMMFGRFVGRVSYDQEEDYYFLALRGARLPFKTDPREALEISLKAPGKDVLAKNSALLLGLLGSEVQQVTILINPDEEDEIMPAVVDLERYLKMVSAKRFAGVAYTKPGGKLENSVVKGSQIQSLEDATPQAPIIQIKGPKSKAKTTVVEVLGKGRFIIQGKTYQDAYRAADFVGIHILKMLCGSPDCPDASACATGGDCGCSR